MRTVLLSQRVEIVSSYQERRDCLDQRWCGFVQACGFAPVPVMNDGQDIGKLIELTDPAGIILTGGNDLARYGGNAPERDATERALISMGIEKGIPIFGVCRGMQMIVDYFGGVLTPVQGHVAKRHVIHGSQEREVNSYHSFGVLDAPEELEVLCRAEDGIIEAVRHRDHQILAVMWHPEREDPYCPDDIELVQQLFNEGRA